MALEPPTNTRRTICRRALRPDDRSLRPDAVGQHCHHPVGEHGGVDRVAALARNAGVKSAQGTPSMPIGSYDATPLDMAGAYTIYANSGVHIDPWLLASVRTPTGDIIEDYTPTTRQVLDARVAYLTTSMMEAVMNNGTAASVRGLGFTAPAAGKTGTDHDAWFAALQATCFASCGLAMTTTRRSIRQTSAACRVHAPPHRSGRSS